MSGQQSADVSHHILPSLPFTTSGVLVAAGAIRTLSDTTVITGQHQLHRLTFLRAIGRMDLPSGGMIYRTRFISLGMFLIRRRHDRERLLAGVRSHRHHQGYTCVSPFKDHTDDYGFPDPCCHMETMLFNPVNDHWIDFSYDPGRSRRSCQYYAGESVNNVWRLA